MANLATGGNGWTLVGMEAYAETGQQAVARGLSPDVIQSEAFIAAVGDMLLDRILHSSVKGTGVIKSALEGGLTNAGTNALNNAIDTEMAGDLSNISILYARYRKEGLSDEEARQKLLKKEVLTIVKDFLTGAAMAGAAHGAGKLYTKVKGDTAHVDVVDKTKGDGDIPPENVLGGGEDVPELDKTKKVIKNNIKARIFREATQQDVDLINDIKARYNAGKTRNAASAIGNINGENINLECISGKFTHDNYFNKGNFEPPQPENYHYIGPIPEYTNHTEQKIVEYLREKFKDNPNVSGEIEIISERIYCDNCKVLVDIFEEEFPNIIVTRVEVVKNGG